MHNSKKFTYPLAFSLACILSYYGVYFLLAWLASVGGAFVAFLCYMVIGFATILYLFLFVVPIYCFQYGRKVLLNAKQKILFTFYNSFVLALFFLIVLYIEGENYLYAVLLFAWAEIFSALPLLLREKAQNTPTE